MAIIESAGQSDVGRLRKGNEDSFFIDEDLQLYVVADGMGGHKAGEVASKMVCDTIQDFMKRLSESDEQELSGLDNNLSKEANRLMSSIHLANRMVHQASENNPAQKGMGSTVSAICFAGDTMIVGNVGDSPIYLIRNGEIKLISKLHTMMAEYADMAPTGSKELGEQFKHVLTRAMGQKASVEPDVSELPTMKGDIVVISSDGLTDMVEPEDILKTVLDKPPGVTCPQLVDMANANGGRDNITVIVLKTVEGPEPAPAKKAAPPKERKRATISIPVDYDTDEDSHQGTAIEIDENSVLIRTSDAIAVGEELMMMFAGSDNLPGFSASGDVVSRSPKGIEIKFTSLKPDIIEAIQKLLS